MNPGVVKQPWEMTLAEAKEDIRETGYRLLREANRTGEPIDWTGYWHGYGGRGWLTEPHKRAVKAAIEAGLPVPDEVLADYPELRAGNPGVVKRFLGGVLGKASWVLSFDEFLTKVRAEMVRTGQLAKDKPLAPIMVDTLRVMYDEAAEAYRVGGPEAVDEALKGVRRNPIDMATILAVGVLAGAVQGVVEPYVTRHVYGQGTKPVGAVENPGVDRQAAYKAVESAVARASGRQWSSDLVSSQLLDTASRRMPTFDVTANEVGQIVEAITKVDGKYRPAILAEALQYATAAYSPEPGRDLMGPVDYLKFLVSHQGETDEHGRPKFWGAERAKQILGAMGAVGNPSDLPSRHDLLTRQQGVFDHYKSGAPPWRASIIASVSVVNEYGVPTNLEVTTNRTDNKWWLERTLGRKARTREEMFESNCTLTGMWTTTSKRIADEWVAGIEDLKRGGGTVGNPYRHRGYRKLTTPSTHLYEVWKTEPGAKDRVVSYEWHTPEGARERARELANDQAYPFYLVRMDTHERVEPGTWQVGNPATTYLGWPVVIIGSHRSWDKVKGLVGEDNLIELYTYDRQRSAGTGYAAIRPSKLSMVLGVRAVSRAAFRGKVDLHPAAEHTGWDPWPLARVVAEEYRAAGGVPPWAEYDAGRPAGNPKTGGEYLIQVFGKGYLAGSEMKEAGIKDRYTHDPREALRVSREQADELQRKYAGTFAAVKVEEALRVGPTSVGNPRRRFMDELMDEHVRMPGFPQMIVTRAFMWGYLKGLGWNESERGIGSLENTVFIPKPVEEPLTDDETRDYNLSLPRVVEAMRRGNPKPVAEMRASEINKVLDRLEAEDSGLTDEMIEVGRGNERPSEYLKMTDPLAMRLRANWELRSALYGERDRRYGPGAPSRLPARLGPMKNPDSQSPHFKAGYRWLKAKSKSSKGSFSTTPGADQYLKKQGYEGTLELARTMPVYGVLKQRVEAATAIRQEFLDGVEAAWEEKLAVQRDSNPGTEPRFYVREDDWPLKASRKWWSVYDSVTGEKMNLRPGTGGWRFGSERLAQKAADKLNKEWAAGKIEVVAEGDSHAA